jgi:diketogulonate reductase-like aldo/keto reductase
MANKTKEWVVQEIEESLKQCGLDYIDLYLIHGLVFRLSSGCRDS